MGKCPVCETNPLEGKQRYCSDACRKKAHRTALKMGLTPSVAEAIVKDPEEAGDLRHTFSETDKLFDDYRPGYYVFALEERKLECHDCGKPFTTHLANLRFCSPDCQQRMLRRLTGMEKSDERKTVRSKKG